MKQVLRRFERRRRSRGVTLIEVLVTVAILSILATVVGVSAFQIHRQKQKDVAKLSASGLRRSVSVWRLAHSDGECPTFARPRADGIVDREVSPTDPWGSAYLVTCADDDVTVRSPGPDRKPGTPDDIVAPPETAVAGAP